MGNFNVTSWILVLGFLSLSSLAAQSQAPIPVGVDRSATQVAGESERGYVPRDFQSDGTTPAISKGREVKLDVKREVQPASLDSPTAQTASLALPRMPHGYLDPTHPAGPAEAGSAAPLQMPKRKPGPYTSGFTVVQIWRTTR